MYQYLNFTGHHPNYPEKQISVEAFSLRGARIKVRKILASMHLIDKKEPLESIKVNQLPHDIQ